LNDTAPFMGGGGIPYLINSLHSRVHSRVKANSIFRTSNVQVNGSRHTNGINTVVRQLLGSGKGTVPADHHQPFNAVLAADLRSLPLAFLRAEFSTAGRVQESASLRNGVRHIPGCQIH